MWVIKNLPAGRQGSKSKIQNYKWMTLIEILIAIFVFGVGILSITTLMTRNIATTQRVHTQNTALILAREGMEMLYNYRDTNTILGYERNCGQTEWAWRGDDETITCTSYRWSGETRYRTIDSNEWSQKISMQPLQITDDNFASLWSGARLFLSPHAEHTIPYERYDHHSSGTATIYARYLIFSGLSDIPTWSPITSHDILSVKSTVLYEQWWYTGQISLSSFIASPE